MATADATKRSPSTRDVILRVGGFVLIGVVLWVLFTRIVDWDDFVDAVAGLTAADWTLLAGVALVRIALEPLLLMAATPRLSWAKALPGFLAPAATASVVPGPSDLAARYAMFRSWGYSGAQTSASVILVFLYSTFAKVGLPVAAAALFVLFGRSNAQLETVAFIAAGVLVGGVVLVALLLRSEATARRIGHSVGIAAARVAGWFRITTPDTLAADVAERAAHFRERTGDVVRTRTHWAAGAAALGQLGMFAILLTSVRAVGIPAERLDWVAVFAAFAFVQLLTSVPITPSGLGVAEAAYVAILTAESSTDVTASIAAAAVIYRVFSWVVIVPFGAIAWLWWTRNRNRVGQDSSSESQAESP